MKAADFKAELKRLVGGYLFYGEEDYLKSHYLEAARDCVTDKGDFFNRIIITADNYSPELLMSHIEALPVMSEKKFIEISGLSLNDMKESEISELTEILGRLKEYEYNVLIIVTNTENFDEGTPKKPSKLLNTLSSVLTPVSFPKESPARLASWVVKHFTSELIVAPPTAVDLLIKRCSYSMSMLSTEIKKLCCFLKEQGREKLTEEDVKLVSSETSDFAEFDFANAILDRNTSYALSILTEYRLKKVRPEMILGGIIRNVTDLYLVRTMLDSGESADTIAKKTKIHSFKVGLYAKSSAKTTPEKLKDLLFICYEADKKIKSSQLDSYTVLDRLAVEASAR